MTQGLPTAIIGFGVTGQAVARYLRRQNEPFVVVDTRAKPKVLPDELADVRCFWQASSWPDIAVARAVLSPGLSMTACIVRSAQAAGVRLISDIDLFFEVVTQPVYAVTGTNGKSTVTALLGHMLSRLGQRCGTGGNLGHAALDLLADPQDCYVLELSSFQLERSREHPYQAATILNLSEDHLDHHTDMARYTASKQRIYSYAKHAVFNRDDARTRPKVEAGSGSSFGLSSHETDWCIRDGWVCHGTKALFATDQLPLVGRHNQTNVLAACAMLEGIDSDENVVAACAGFQGLAHRFELVARIDGITFVNDSKATNVGATLAALAGFAQEQSVVLVAGGQAKGADLSPLGEAMAGRVKHLVCLGESTPELVSIAQRYNLPHSTAANMIEAVGQAHDAAVAGDHVLLSPACASFDGFANFADRGEQFAQVVRARDTHE